MNTKLTNLTINTACVALLAVGLVACAGAPQTSSNYGYTEGARASAHAQYVKPRQPAVMNNNSNYIYLSNNYSNYQPEYAEGYNNQPPRGGYSYAKPAKPAEESWEYTY